MTYRAQTYKSTTKDFHDLTEMSSAVGQHITDGPFKGFWVESISASILKAGGGTQRVMTIQKVRDRAYAEGSEIPLRLGITMHQIEQLGFITFEEQD